MKRKRSDGIATLWVLFKLWSAILSLPVLFTMVMLAPAMAVLAGEQGPVGPSGLARPVFGQVTSPFGFRLAPDTGGSEFHTGVDIASEAGTPVKAAAAGEVRFAGWADRYGYLIILRHRDEAGTFETWYGHLSVIAVAKGTVAQAGAVIGLVGSTGRSTGPHLHFEYRVNGKPVDPHFDSTAS